MNLIGQQVVIMVGEPWDYESPEGGNRITGRIVEIRSFRGQRTVVVDSEQDIVVHKLKARGKRLLLQARHVGSRIESIRYGKRIVAGIAIVPHGKSAYAGIYAMIGTICLAGHENGPVG